MKKESSSSLFPNFTVRALLLAIFGSILMTASSMYVALRMSALPWPTIFVAVLSLTLMRLFKSSNLKEVNVAALSKKLNVGEMTLEDIVKELLKPGRDPREDLPKPILRSDVLKLEDISENMILTGTVRNVLDFGVFVDIGIKNDGLVHISEMSDRFIKNPSDIASVGDIVKVKVIGIDKERQKVKLSMKI